MFASGPISLPSEKDTAAFAARIAPYLRAGDTLLLDGQIGAGKSAFCRALIRWFCGAQTSVPSPTFTLIQTYEAPEFEIWHCDLYRLTSPDEMLELGLEAAFETALTLIEWPDRLGELAPEEALHLSLQADSAQHVLKMHSASERWQSLTEVLHV